MIEDVKRGWVNFKKFLIDIRGYTEEEADEILKMLGLEE